MDSNTKEGALDEVELAQTYGFKKAISLFELMAVYPEMSPLMLKDFKGDHSRIETSKVKLLQRF